MGFTKEVVNRRALISASLAFVCFTGGQSYPSRSRLWWDRLASVGAA